MTEIAATAPAATPESDRSLPAIPGWTVWLSVLLAAVAAVSAAVTALAPGVLSGTAVMNGSARGTAWVVLVVGVPCLLASVPLALRGSLRAYAVWLGSVAYLAYNGVMFCFATPFNSLFLLYVAGLSLSVWVLIGLVVAGWHIDLGELGHAGRWVAVYMLLIVAANTVLWLRVVVPAVFADDPTSILDGTGLTTSPVFVQDLAFWLPAMAWLGVGLLRDNRHRLVLAAGGLVFWVIEAVSVAVDQWLGGRADPGSTVASASVAPGFVVLALVGLVPVIALMRRIR